MRSGISRRSFTKVLVATAGAAACGHLPASGQSAKALHLATNDYPWKTFYRRAGADYGAQLDKALREIAAAGLDGLEPAATNSDEVRQLVPRLKQHKLQMRSLYVNSTLHDPDRVDASMQSVLEIAEAARPAGTRIIVTNPQPIKWGGPENKSDQQIRFQAEALNRLGTALRQQGLTLAYHFHDIELRLAARELHHMMVGTDPELVSLCLDTHWIYRGAGNSEVAVFDIAQLYADRIVELHVRQSRGGVWTEALGEGDIDYARLVQFLAARQLHPLVVLEQAVEAGSPDTLTAEQAHRSSVAYARRVFSPLAAG